MWIAGIAGLLVVIVGSSPVALYLYGLTLLPNDRTPHDPGTVPAIARALLWRELGGKGSPAMPVLNPYTHFSEPSGPGMRLAAAAGRRLLNNGEDPRPWQPAFYSSVVWVSRNWSTEEALSTVLARAYYGHNFYGFEAAARGYFGLSADSLTAFETAQLVALTRSASRFDPWCKVTASRTRASELVGPDAAQSPTRLRDPPADACM
jgi:Transglycosylase